MSEQVNKASDTPRTDALFIEQQWSYLLPGGVVEQWYHLALDLERELAAERHAKEVAIDARELSYREMVEARSLLQEVQEELRLCQKDGEAP